MAGPSPLHPLEQEDPSTRLKEWRVQRVGWVVLALVVVLALAGLFGTGPLSWSSVSADDGSVVVDYSRFGRDGGPTTLDVRVAPAAVDGDQVLVWVGHDLLRGLEIQQITPEPSSQTTVDGGVVLTFDVEIGAGLDASIAATADRPGFRRGTLGLVGQDPLELWQLFYP